jgi:hypothetical protein
MAASAQLAYDWSARRFQMRGRAKAFLDDPATERARGAYLEQGRICWLWRCETSKADVRELLDKTLLDASQAVLAAPGEVRKECKTKAGKVLCCLAASPGRCKELLDRTQEPDRISDVSDGKWADHIAKAVRQLSREADDGSGRPEGWIKAIDQVATALRRQLSQEILAQLEPAIQAGLRRPPADSNEKREIRDLINDALTAAGLAIQGQWDSEPRTTACSIQVMDTSRGGEGTLVLKERARAPGHSHQRVSAATSTLDDIRLMIVLPGRDTRSAEARPGRR